MSKDTNTTDAKTTDYGNKASHFDKVVRELFIKNIEIYDGNWSYHYVCRFGIIIMSTSLIWFWISLPIFLWFGAAKQAFITSAITLVLFIIGSCIGKENE